MAWDKVVTNEGEVVKCIKISAQIFTAWKCGFGEIIRTTSYYYENIKGWKIFIYIGLIFYVSWKEMEVNRRSTVVVFGGLKYV